MCVRHALLSIKAVHKIPTIRVEFGASKTKVFETADYKIVVKNENNGQPMSIEDLFSSIVDKLDQSTVLT